MRISLPDKCLLYLLDRTDVTEDDRTAEQLVQDRIGESLGVTRADVSRAMTRLAGKKLARTAKVHVAGKKKRLLAYFLTDEGVRSARRTRMRIEGMTVTFVDEEGRERRCRLYEAMSTLPRRLRFAEIAMHLEGDRLDVRKLKEWRERVYGGKVFDARDAISVPNFRGRAEMLARLDAFMDDPKAKCFLLTGLPGIGKTALASKWVGGLKGRVHVLWRRIGSETTARDMLREIGGLLSSTGRPGLAEYMQRPAEADVDQSVNILKRDISGVRALIVMDNAHLAQRDVASLVSEIIRLEPGREGPKVLLISRQRLRFWRPEEAAHGAVVEEELRNLPRDEAVEMMTALGVKEARMTMIWEHCRGHPLSVELAADEAVSLGETSRTTASWLTQEVLSGLDPGALEAIAFAAVFEGPIQPGLLGGYMHELSRLCLVRESGEDAVDLHDIVREAALQNLPPQRLTELHVRAGRYLAGSRSPRDLLEAMSHFIRAEAYEEAASLAAESGIGLVEAGFSERLLAHLDQLAPSTRRLSQAPRVRLLRGQALFALGRHAEAVRAFEKCIDSDDRRLVGEAFLGMGKAELLRNSTLAETYLMRARECFESLGALRLLAETEYWIGGIYEDSARLDKAQATFERGRAIAFDVGDRRWEGLCVYGLAQVKDMRRQFNEAAETCREALELLEREGSRLDIAKVCTALGGILMTAGRREEGRPYLMRGLDEARAAGAVNILSACLFSLGWLNTTDESYAKSVPYFREALELNEQQERYAMAARCSAMISAYEWKEGSAKAGDEYMARAQKFISRVKEATLRAQVLWDTARAYRRAGKMAECRRDYDRAVAEAHSVGYTAFEEKLQAEIKERFG